jgi:hypothetical protein
MIGEEASLHSARRKSRNVRPPKTRRQTTMLEDQGKVDPPNWRPRRNIVVAATMRKLPSQSMAFRPASKGIFSVSSLTVKKMQMNAMPVRGTMVRISKVDLCLVRGGYPRLM